MKLTATAISDTHNKHRKILLPNSDVLIHAGDFSSRGFKHEIEEFLNWLMRRPNPYKIFIAGNHDISFENRNKGEEWGFVNEAIDKFTKDPTCFYLENSGCQIEGVNFWGSPYTPRFGRGWAFNSDRGPDIRKHWDLIPRDTHVLITHGPAHCKVDRADPNNWRPFHEYVGCEQLAWVIKDIKPLVHICGHVHEAYGVDVDMDTVYINAATCNLRYEPINKPVQFEIDIDNKTINPF
jgi:predicted phosphodiesterase